MSPQAHARLIRDHFAPVYRFAFHLTGDSDLAAQLTRRAFLPAFAPLRRARLALLRDLCRSAELFASRLPAPPAPPAPPPAPLLRVDPPLRACLCLFYLENLGANEIGDLLGLPVEDVCDRLRLGKAQLAAAPFAGA